METMQIRPMDRSELELALDWAADEGWNPGLHDGVAFAAADPAGMFVGVVDGEPVATIACVRYGEEYGFVGLYIVRPDARGEGFGLELWRAGHAHLGERVSGLDAVSTQVGNYMRSGYRTAWFTTRYEGRGTEVAAAPAEGVAPIGYADAVAVDARGFPGPRHHFLQVWLAMPDARVLGLRRDGEVVGYGVLRRCRVGWKVGPLFAPDAEAAEALLDALVAGIDAPFWLDVPHVNEAAVDLARRRGMEPTFRTARMYRGPAPEYDTASVFGGTSLELG
jgi:Acetyltransferase (GNAT) domain